MKAIERELTALRGRGDRRGEEALSERKLKVSVEVDRLNREALGGSAG